MTIDVEKLQLNEIIVQTLKEMLENDLPTIIKTLNESFKDGITLQEPSSYLPYVPSISDEAGGMPIIGIGDQPTKFVDDLQYEITGKHILAVIILYQSSNRENLALSLRRYIRAIIWCIQQDRERPLRKEETYLSQKAGSWYTKYLGVEPGPLVGEHEPGQPDMPTSWKSWSGLGLEFTRQEI